MGRPVAMPIWMLARLFLMLGCADALSFLENVSLLWAPLEALSVMLQWGKAERNTASVLPQE